MAPLVSPILLPTTLKFVGCISLGLLTGHSSSLAAVALPSLHLAASSPPSTTTSSSSSSAAAAAAASRSLAALSGSGSLVGSSSSLAGLSAASLLLAFALSPRGARHPYLLWAALAAAGAGAAGWLVADGADHHGLGKQQQQHKSQGAQKKKAKKTTPQRMRMDASYEMVGAGDGYSEGTDNSADGEEEEEEEMEETGAAGSGDEEEVRRAMQSFRAENVVRAGFAAVGFAMTVVGIWGDGA